ncbi:MAG: hypothetical protein COC01_02230 [Bacteroidetes bacterium]|nr:MAG: hypothetical protein COC01_02230 [Bacteroidota bacterium]
MKFIIRLKIIVTVAFSILATCCLPIDSCSQSYYDEDKYDPSIVNLPAYNDGIRTYYNDMIRYKLVCKPKPIKSRSYIDKKTGERVNVDTCYYLIVDIDSAKVIGEIKKKALFKLLFMDSYLYHLDPESGYYLFRLREIPNDWENYRYYGDPPSSEWFVCRKNGQLHYGSLWKDYSIYLYYKDIASYHFLRQNYLEAISYYSKIIEMCKLDDRNCPKAGYGGILYMRAGCKLRVQDYRGSIVDYKDYLNYPSDYYKPFIDESYLDLGQCYNGLKDYDKALVYLNKAEFKGSWSSGQVDFEKGIALINLGRTEEGCLKLSECLNSGCCSNVIDYIRKYCNE